jgi:hypothetical protein
MLMKKYKDGFISSGIVCKKPSPGLKVIRRGQTHRHDGPKPVFPHRIRRAD